VVITATGSLSDYDDDKKAEIAAAVAATLPGVSASDISVLVVAGSVVITIEVAVPAATTAEAVRGRLATSLGTTSAATSTLHSAGVTVAEVALPWKPSAASLSVDMSVGWTWISLNVQPVDGSISAVFGGLSISGGDYVKSQSSFSEYYSGYGFFGGLATLTTDQMYQAKLATSGTLVLEGVPVALPKILFLSVGWSWVPCPYQSPVPLASGAPSFSYAQGDQFKSQSQFAEFYVGYGWFGTLVTLQPGRGYKLRVAGSGSATYLSV